eukprot:6477776-Amphidinium_carterae.2
MDVLLVHPLPTTQVEPQFRNRKEKMVSLLPFQIFAVHWTRKSLPNLFPKVKAGKGNGNEI